jgi:ribosome recycling factor
MMMVDEYVNAMTEDMKKALESLKQALSTVRTGRASPALLNSVQVNVSSYGATMPITQLATITAPDARLLVVQAWDKSTLSDIEKAIGSAGLGLNPSSDGQVIRVPIPALTGERRKQLTKNVRDFGEDAKIRVRGVRREYNDLFKEAEKDKEISEDDLKRALAKVQTVTDEYVGLVDGMIGAKEKEILEV